MSIKDKKENIIHELQLTTDEKLIDEVYQLLNPSTAIEDVQIDSLPEELQSKINRALDDYKNGRYITHEQMKQKVAQWLTK
jgi:hypothetical protein